MPSDVDGASPARRMDEMAPRPIRLGSRLGNCVQPLCQVLRMPTESDHPPTEPEEVLAQTRWAINNIRPFAWLMAREARSPTKSAKTPLNILLSRTIPRLHQSFGQVIQKITKQLAARGRFCRSSGERG